MKLRQLPQLYLRGAIANETMRHMAAEDRDNIDRLTREISTMPLLAGHKHRFVEKLGHTIGGDYHKNPKAAEQEFDIAIWRALVYLLHHRDYSYRCEACDQSEYITHKNKPKAFDRRYPVCPHCNNVRITNPGGSTYTVGQFVGMEEVQRTILKLGSSASPPQHNSSIISLKGTKKVYNHEAVLNDPQQLVKYFGEFVWNYFRQTLRENEIKFHQLEGFWVDDGNGGQKCIKGRFVSGPADQVAVEEINSLLTQLKIQHSYEPKANPAGGKFHVQVELLITNQSVSAALRSLIDRYNKLGVRITATDAEVMVDVLDGATIVEAIIATPQPVCIQGGSTSEDGQETSAYDVYQHKIRTCAIGGASMQEDGIAQVESNDLIATIRDNLSDGAQQVYDIMLGQGDTYDKFLDFQRGPRGTKSETYCDRPRSTHIARFMGTSPRQVNAWVQDIKVQCLAHNVGDA